MNLLQTKLATSPALARVLPFVVFLGLTFCQGPFGEASRYWFYLAKTVVGAWLIWSVWPLVEEMRWKISWEAGVVGVAVFALWVGLDGLYPSVAEIIQSYVCPILKSIGLDFLCPKPTALHPWNPHVQFGQNTAFAWLFIVVRIVGSSLVVPPLEEVFYRSFLYRWIARPDFKSVPLGLFHWKPFLITALIFGFSHHEWLAGILCAFAYQGLVCWKNRLGDAMTAHAITNCLLGIWVVWKGAWNFW
ncbi:MAG: CAAX prenyl protease-related protein [Verrucomicrobia bacterium]|nr:CAAX prenyl protease-related protein [Verrucomicrobiota bacterium]